MQNVRPLTSVLLRFLGSPLVHPEQDVKDPADCWKEKENLWLFLSVCVWWRL